MIPGALILDNSLFVRGMVAALAKNNVHNSVFKTSMLTSELRSIALALTYFSFLHVTVVPWGPIYIPYFYMLYPR